jgi:arylsulfatase A-like enzyme
VPIAGRSIARLYRQTIVDVLSIRDIDAQMRRADARAGGAWELYHIAEDATETSNLADRHPQRVAELARMWRAWAGRVGAPLR